MTTRTRGEGRKMNFWVSDFPYQVKRNYAAKIINLFPDVIFLAPSWVSNVPASNIQLFLLHVRNRLVKLGKLFFTSRKT